jgi:hypothetical protein
VSAAILLVNTLTIHTQHGPLAWVTVEFVHVLISCVFPLTLAQLDNAARFYCGTHPVGHANATCTDSVRLVVAAHSEHGAAGPHARRAAGRAELVRRVVASAITRVGSRMLG